MSIDANMVTVSTIFYDNLCQLMQKHGHQISTSVTPDENDLITANELATAWEEAIKLSNDRNLGLHLGEQSTIGRWGIVEQLLNHSSSFQECIDHSIRYWKLVGFSDLKIGYQTEFAGKKGTSAITLHTAAPFRHIAESDAVYTIRMMQMLLASDFHPSAVWFMHPAPEDTSEHERIFGVTPHFNKPYLAIFFDQAWVKETRTVDTALTAILQQHAEQRLTALHSANNHVEKTRIILNQAPATSLDEVAKALHISNRTLQIKLESSNQTFQGLKDQVRCEKAKTLLADTSLSLGEIAFMLGFSDSSTFSHFCKRQLAMSPSQWRRSRTNP